MPPPSGPRRLRDIFPAGFDPGIASCSTSLGSTSYPYTTMQLYERLTLSYDPEGLIESVQVKSVWYGKQKRGVRHEFISIEVYDINTTFVNYIVLDRNLAAKKVGRTSSRGLPTDAYRVSYDGIERRLVQECGLDDREYVEKLEFDDAEPLYLYQLATLVQVVSRRSQTYNLGGENCYWFAGVVWECLRVIRPRTTYTNQRPKVRGKFALLRYTPDEKERQQIFDEFLMEIEDVEERLKESRQSHMGTSTAADDRDKHPATVDPVSRDPAGDDSSQTFLVIDPDYGSVGRTRGLQHRGGYGTLTP